MTPPRTRSFPARTRPCWARLRCRLSIMAVQSCSRVLSSMWSPVGYHLVLRRPRCRRLPGVASGTDPGRTRTTRDRRLRVCGSASRYDGAGSAGGAGVGGGCAVVAGRRVEAGPGAVQPFLADGGELLAALPQREGVLEGRRTGLEPAHHLDELFAGVLVGRARVVGHGANLTAHEPAAGPARTCPTRSAAARPARHLPPPARP